MWICWLLTRHHAEMSRNGKSDVVHRLMITHPPPPIPAIARATISISIEGAKPHRIVPEPGNMSGSGPCCIFRILPNRVRAMSSAPFRPRISDKRPQTPKSQRPCLESSVSYIPYSGVKQQTDNRYDVPMYEDWLNLLKEPPIGAKRVATMVPLPKTNSLV